MTQAQLDHLLLPICRILADGSLNLNHQKLIADQNYDISQHFMDNPHSTRSDRGPSRPPRNPKGRASHRAIPTNVSAASTLQPTLRLADITRATRRQLDSARLPDNASRVSTTVEGAPLNGHHLTRLQSNEQIHDVVVGAYLKLLAASKPDTTRAFDTQFLHKLRNDTHQQIDRMFRMRRTNTTKDILAYDTLLLPVQKPGHFVDDQDEQVEGLIARALVANTNVASAHPRPVSSHQ
jgi:hypothetical protein